MTRPLRFRPAAVADLDAIWTYTAERWGVAQAERYLRELQAACLGLAKGERRSQDASHIRPGYAKLHAGRHIIFHRAMPDGSFEIVRILHERMDITSRLDD